MSRLHKNIEVIEGNAGGITVQNTETKQVAFFCDKYSENAIESLEELMEGGDIDDWGRSPADHYIEYDNDAWANGCYRYWDICDIEENIADCWYQRARARVREEEELRSMSYTLLNDWGEGLEHWKWLATAKTEDIESWMLDFVNAR